MIIQFECDSYTGGNYCNIFETDKWTTMQDGINVHVSTDCPKCGCTCIKVITIEQIFNMLAKFSMK